VAEVSHFLAAHLRYATRNCRGGSGSLLRRNRRGRRALGARDVPKSRQAVADYLQRMRPQLLCDERSREVLRLLLDAPAPRAGRPLAT
jgi:uncharacterized protein (DUF2236 family)